METPPARPGARGFAGIALLLVAVMLAVVVAFYLFRGDGATSPAASPGGPGLAPANSAAPDTGPLSPRRPREGELAPDFALVDARNGATVRKLSDFRGKAVVVNWYASWCGPCRSEIPEFQAAQDALPGDVVFLGVDYMESRERATDILDVLGAKYPAVLDTFGAVAEHYRVGEGLPTTFFVDRDGILRGMKTGRVTTSELEKFLARSGVTYKAPAQ